MLQLSLDIHEGLVFAVLALRISSDVGQLRLDAVDHVLDLLQLGTVTLFRLCQGALQCGSLRVEQGKPQKGRCQMQESLEGGEHIPISLQILTYHVELGLKFYFQRLEGVSQVTDFRLAALQLLSIDSYFTVQLFGLKQGKLYVRNVGPLNGGHKAFTALFCVV